MPFALTQNRNCGELQAVAVAVRVTVVPGDCGECGLALSMTAVQGAGTLTAAAALIRPNCQETPVPGTGSAVVSMRCVSDSAVASGETARTKAARPLT